MNEEEKVSNGGTRERQTRGLFALWRDYWFWCRGGDAPAEGGAEGGSRKWNGEPLCRESRPFQGASVYAVCSAKRTVPAASSNILEGLMSPWQIPKLWMYCRPLAA